jgi:hypothetical protein
MNTVRQLTWLLIVAGLVILAGTWLASLGK